MAAVRVSAVTAKGCDLNGIVIRLASGSVFMDWDENNPKLRAYGIGLRKDTHDFIWRSGSRNVIVRRFATENQVADAAADEVGRGTAFAQGARDTDGLCRLGRGEVQCLGSPLWGLFIFSMLTQPFRFGLTHFAPTVLITVRGLKPKFLKFLTRPKRAALPPACSNS